eukprot:SAG31_NODE_2728_length_5180_cov_2.415469_2_plen_544_part_00
MQSGSPYATGSVETCCTVTWGAMCVEMLKLTGASVAADELELSLFNSGLFLLSPSGRWCVYDSPMDGVRESTTLQIGSAQNKDGASELSCCACNGPRMVGLPAQWAVMAVGNTIKRAGNYTHGYALNLYGAGVIQVPLDDVNNASGGSELKISQTTDYPVGDGSVVVQLQRVGLEVNELPTVFDFWLRIPCWSERTTATLNGKALSSPRPGTYMKLEGLSLSQTHTIELKLDFRLRCWVQPTNLSARSGAGTNLLAGPEALPDSQSRPAAAQGAPSTPFWTSSNARGWTATGRKDFTGSADGPTVIKTAAIGAGATTGCGWFGGCNWSKGGKEMIVMSFGAADAAPGFSRALSLGQSNCNYFGYQGTGTQNPDLLSLVNGEHLQSWFNAMNDRASWHHIAVTDDGQTVSVILDGVIVGLGKHKVPPATTAGAIVGGWGVTGNRDYVGALSGVELYHSCLSIAEVTAAMKQTKPVGLPPAVARRGCLYRGPLLLGFDPAYNLKTPSPPPALDPSTLEHEMRKVESGLRFIEPVRCSVHSISSSI